MKDSDSVCCIRRLIVVVATGLCCVTGLAASEAAQLTIILHEHAFVNSRQVLLRDVAKIVGASERDRIAAGALDLADLEQLDQPLEIRQSLVRIRLILNGWAPDSLGFQGAESVLVSFRRPRLLTDADIEQVAIETLSSAWDIPPEDLQVRLDRDFMTDLPTDVQATDGLQVTVVAPGALRLGSMGLVVRLQKDQRTVCSRNARFEVLKRFRVPVTRVSLQRNAKLTSDNIQFEQRFLPRAADESSEEDVIGFAVRSDVDSGTVLSPRDLQAPVRVAPPVIVKRKDSVRVVARVGRIQVVLQAAEAQQDGREGETIRLKNLKTGEMISGRVMPEGYVVVLNRTM